MKLDQVIKNYFLFFEKKKIEKLEKILTKDFILKDWNVHFKSREKFFKFYKKNFIRAEIKINIRKIIINKKKNIAICIINVLVNKKKLGVIDVLYFNKQNKIKKVFAHLISNEKF